MGFPRGTLLCKHVSFITHNRFDPVTGCWNWMAAKNPGGYGVMNYLRHRQLVHRVSAHCYLGFDLASKLFVLHRCDNPACFNPKHLFIGNDLDNQRDAMAKGRRYEQKLTNCPQGHPYIEENIIWKKDRKGKRCRTCTLKRAVEYSRRKRAEQLHIV